MQLKLASIQTPQPHQGFLGPGHVARAVIQGNFAQSDPFIVLMDDDLTVPDGDPVGGPHPHAGFETVTLILEGTSNNSHEGFNAGDFQMMTAGSGIIHTESIDPGTRVHLLQLWLTLPKADRWTTPRVQNLTLKNVPMLKQNGSEIRVYSGSFAGLTSPVLNHVPVTIADIHLDAGATTAQSLKPGYNTFLYVTNGSVRIGDKELKSGQVGWLDNSDERSDLTLTAGDTNSRVVLYSAEPQRTEIVSYGPFIGEKQRDIIRLYEEYHAGKMKHVNVLPEEQVFNY